MNLLNKKTTSDIPAITRELVLVNKLGMHARPAAMFVKITSRHESEVMVQKDGEEVDGKSIMGLMMLAAGLGSKLLVTARGPDAEKVLDELEKLVARKFDEE